MARVPRSRARPTADHPLGPAEDARGLDLTVRRWLAPRPLAQHSDREAAAFFAQVFRAGAGAEEQQAEVVVRLARAARALLAGAGEPDPAALLGARILLEGTSIELGDAEARVQALSLALLAEALAGRRPVWVAASDELAERRYEALEPALARLGLAAGLLVSTRPGQAGPSRLPAAACFAGARALGFEALRDDVALRGRGSLASRLSPLLDACEGQLRLAGLGLALVEDVDRVALDLGKTPLVLSRPAPPESPDARMLAIAVEIASGLEPRRDFAASASGTITLTEPGRTRLEAAATPHGGAFAVSAHRESLVVQALEAIAPLERGRDYHVGESGIEAAAGVSLPERAVPWLEAREGLAIRSLRAPAARSSLLRILVRFRNLSGTSGQLSPARAELRRLGLGPLARIGRQGRASSTVRFHDDDTARDDALASLARDEAVLAISHDRAALGELKGRLEARGVPVRAPDDATPFAGLEISLALGPMQAPTWAVLLDPGFDDRDALAAGAIGARAEAWLVPPEPSGLVSRMTRTGGVPRRLAFRLLRRRALRRHRRMREDILRAEEQREQVLSFTGPGG